MKGGGTGAVQAWEFEIEPQRAKISCPAPVLIDYGPMQGTCSRAKHLVRLAVPQSIQGSTAASRRILLRILGPREPAHPSTTNIPPKDKSEREMVRNLATKALVSTPWLFRMKPRPPEEIDHPSTKVNPADRKETRPPVDPSCLLYAEDWVNSRGSRPVNHV